MVNLDEQKVKEIFREYSKAIVGRLCKNIETLQENCDKQSPQFLALQLAKNLHKETIYQNLRDLELTLKFASQGKSLEKFNIYTPSDSK